MSLKTRSFLSSNYIFCKWNPEQIEKQAIFFSLISLGGLRLIFSVRTQIKYPMVRTSATRGLPPPSSFRANHSVRY